MKNMGGHLKIILKGEVCLFIEVLDTYLLYYMSTKCQRHFRQWGFRTEQDRQKSLPSESLHFSRERQTITRENKNKEIYVMTVDDKDVKKSKQGKGVRELWVWEGDNSNRVGGPSPAGRWYWNTNLKEVGKRATEMFGGKHSWRGESKCRPRGGAMPCMSETEQRSASLRWRRQGGEQLAMGCDRPRGFRQCWPLWILWFFSDHHGRQGSDMLGLHLGWLWELCWE